MQFGEWKMDLNAKDSLFRKYLASLDNWGDENSPSKNKEKCIFQISRNHVQPLSTILYTGRYRYKVQHSRISLLVKLVSCTLYHTQKMYLCTALQDIRLNSRTLPFKVPLYGSVYVLNCLKPRRNHMTFDSWLFFSSLCSHRFKSPCSILIHKNLCSQH